MKKFAVISKDDKESIRVAKEVQSFLFRNGLSYSDKEAELVCVVGGDGTFLSAIHKHINRLDSVVFSGINTGTLGFFNDYTHDELDQFLDDIINKTPTIEEKRLLKIRVIGEKTRSFLAVNEVRIENVIKTQTIDVYVNETKLETYRGTGLCVCSQVGSTAYNRSLRGAVIETGLDVMELTEIIGIHHVHYRSLGVPLILSGSNTIRMEADYDDTSLLCFDRFVVNLNKSASVEVSLSNQKFRLAHFRPTEYIQRLYHLF